MLTMRSIYKGIIIIYGTTGDSMVLAYTIFAIASLLIGIILYIIGLIESKHKE